MARTARSAQMIANRKQLRVVANWSGEVPDRSWMKFIRCKGCGMRLCVNNNPQRRVNVMALERRAGGYVHAYDGKVKWVLCWRCVRFKSLFKQLYYRTLGSDPSKKAVKHWGSYPALPYPGEA